MKTEGPAMSFLTSCWLLPQNEQYRTFSLEEPFFSAMDRDFDVSTGGCEDDSSKEIGTFPWRKAPIPALLLLRRNRGATVSRWRAIPDASGPCRSARRPSIPRDP